MYDVDLPTARDCMTTRARVLAFSPEHDIFEAMAELLKHHFAAAPVVDADNHVLGMLTEKDCLRILSNLAYDDDAEGGRVSDFQSSMRLTCEPGMDIFGVTNRFLECNFPLLPVVEDDSWSGSSAVGIPCGASVSSGGVSIRREANWKLLPVIRRIGLAASRACSEAPPVSLGNSWLG